MTKNPISITRLGAADSRAACSGVITGSAMRASLLTTLACAWLACAPTVPLGDLRGDDAPSTGAGSSETETETGVSTLAEAIPGAERLAYANGSLFVTTRVIHQPEPYTYDLRADTSDIVRLPLTGGVPVPIAIDVPYISSFVADESYAYFVENNGTIEKVPVEGGARELVYQGADPAVLYPADVPIALALDASYLYWASLDGSIKRIALEGGALSTVVPPSEYWSVMNLAVDEAHLYWTVYADGPVELDMAPLDGGPTSVIYSGDLSLISLFASGNYVYAANLGHSTEVDWSQNASGDGSIVRVRIDGSEPVSVLASDQPAPQSIAVDETGVYWGGGLFRRYEGDPNEVSVGTAPVTRLTPDESALNDVAHSVMASSMVPCEQGVCWIDESTGDVMRFDEAGL